MEFSAEFLRDILFYDVPYDGVSVVDNQQVSKSKWCNTYFSVFRWNNKLYRVIYDIPHSDHRDYIDFFRGKQFVDCPEVEEYREMVEIVRYVIKQEKNHV